jgi:alkylation response protein AidB-like acyl-CoA dehydrogenase
VPVLEPVSPLRFPVEDLPEAAVMLRAEGQAFLAEEVAAGAFVRRCDAWLSGSDPAFARFAAGVVTVGPEGVAPLWKVAAAKIRCGEAAGRADAIALQVHGAIGFTGEHVLHRFTLRLWSWRAEFGTEEEWASVLGGLMRGKLWEMVT